MANPSPLRLTSVQWIVCTIAAIGFAFDTYELLMLPVPISGLPVVGSMPKRPSPPELGYAPISDRVSRLRGFTAQVNLPMPCTMSCCAT